MHTHILFTISRITFLWIEWIDELEREEFYRLKKVQDKKKKIKNEKEALFQERKKLGKTYAACVRNYK